jgi:copper transport protein
MRYSRIGFFVIMLLISVIMPSKMYAHSVLLKESTAPSSVTASSPKKVELTFNERLEKELFYIKVLDSSGNSVTSTKTQMSQNQNCLMTQIWLPSFFHLTI